MKLLEHQAHELFRKFGLPAAEGHVVATMEELRDVSGELPYPIVMKAQVQTGGRGKAGGIRIVTDRDELLKNGEELFRLSIKNLPVRKIFLTGKANVEKEMYLAITMDRLHKAPVIIFSAEGGMEINEIAEAQPDKVHKMLVDPFLGVEPFMIRYFADKAGLDKETAKQLDAAARNLYALFTAYDCMLAEINPLVRLADGKLAALDGKVDVEDNALIRHEDIASVRDELTENPLVLEARKWDFLYIPVGNEGSIGVVSNGSGMIMSTIDLISKKGHAVACALDLGGGATGDRVKEAIRIVFGNERVKLCFVNIFGGITRCDEIARGIKGALEADPGRTIIVRMEGTNKEQGIEIINRLGGGVELVPGLVEGVELISGRMSV